MKKSRFTEQQIVAILKEVEIGARVNATCRKYAYRMPAITSGNLSMQAWEFRSFASCAICKRRMPGCRRCMRIWLWCIMPCRMLLAEI